MKMEKTIFLVVAIVNFFFVCVGSDKSGDNYISDSSESSEIEPVQLKVLGANTKDKPNLTTLLAEERCKHHVEIGYCVKNIPRWAFSRGDCYEFEYSGCGGNPNNFHSRESCLHHCDSLIKKGGKVPLSTGSFIISFEESEEVEPPSRRMQRFARSEPLFILLKEVLLQSKRKMSHRFRPYYETNVAMSL